MFSFYLLVFDLSMHAGLLKPIRFKIPFLKSGCFEIPVWMT